MIDRGAADTVRVRALVPFPHGGDLAAAAAAFVLSLRRDGAVETGERCVTLGARRERSPQTTYIVGLASTSPEHPVSWVRASDTVLAELRSHCQGGRYPVPVVAVVDGAAMDPHPTSFYLPHAITAALGGGVPFSAVRHADPWALGIIAWVVVVAIPSADLRRVAEVMAPALIQAPPEENRHRLEAARGAGRALGVGAALDVLRAEGVLP